MTSKTHYNEEKCIAHQEEERFSWLKPQAPTLKCNVDASLQNGSGLFGVGMVLRDFEGVFISARTNAFPDRALVKEAEALAIKEALSWIMEMNIQEVIFKSDAKGVTEAMKSDRDDDSEFGAIILECRELLRQRPSFRVCFTRRQANKVAHSLARESCFHARPSICNSPPDFILEALNEDCNLTYS